MLLSWSARRQLMYYLVGGVIVAVLLFVGYEAFFTSPAMCNDGKQNGTETGVDCGGTCSLICANTAHEPRVLWARSFSTGGGYYTAAAYVQNTNLGSGSRQAHYSFQLFDDKNSLIVEKDGVVDLSPVQTIPIIEPNISTGDRAVSRTLFAFTNNNFSWNKIPAGKLADLHVSQQLLAQDASRLSATLQNNSLFAARNVTVAAVLFDASGTARAASKTLVQSVDANSTYPLVFTWAGGVSNIVRAEITIVPSF